MIRRSCLRGAAALALSLFSLTAAHAQAAPDTSDVMQQVASLQTEWATIQYQTPEDQRASRFEALSRKAHEVTSRHADRAEPHIWEGIILSSWAGAKGGLGALPLVKQAKGEYETAMGIDSKALSGSAQGSLGVLYYKVPGWPIGFGDNAKAETLLRQALAINPDGIDTNFFYGDYLVQRKREAEAIPYLEKALAAPPRPGRDVADKGRKEEVQALLAKVRP